MIIVSWTFYKLFSCAIFNIIFFSFLDIVFRVRFLSGLQRQRRDLWAGGDEVRFAVHRHARRAARQGVSLLLPTTIFPVTYKKASPFSNFCSVKMSRFLVRIAVQKFWRNCFLDFSTRSRQLQRKNPQHLAPDRLQWILLQRSGEVRIKHSTTTISLNRKSNNSNSSVISFASTGEHRN